MFHRLLFAVAVVLQFAASGGRVSDVHLRRGLAGAAEALNPEGLQLSSHKCTDGNELTRTCTFKNLVFQDGRAYYLARGKVKVPRVRVDFRVGDSSPVQLFEVEVVAPEALPPAEAEERRGDAYLWTGCYDSNWPPTRHNPSLKPPSPPVEPTPSYAHCFGENVVSLGNTLCEWMGRCSYESRTGLTVLCISPDERHRDPNSTPAFLRDALTCISDRPLQHVAAPELAGTRLLLARTLVGIGPTSRTRFRDGRKQMPPASMLAWRQRLGECLGFDHLTPAETDRPRILIVARPYSAGRSVLNQDDVTAAVRQRYGRSADIIVRYMEGLSLAQQAELWSQQSIVVHVHGSVLGSWQLLPPGAVVVQLSALPVFHEHAGAFGIALEEDLAAVSPNITWKHLGTTDWAYSHPVTERIWEEGAWAADLSPEAEQAFLRRGDCSAVPPEKEAACITALHHSFNAVFPPDRVVSVLGIAWRELYAKQGLPAPKPRGLPPAEAFSVVETRRGGRGRRGGAPAAVAAGGEAPGLRALATGERVLFAGVVAVLAALQLRHRHRRVAAASQMQSSQV